jgi:polyhydroxyalkanoate synthesis regulator phasin
MIKRILFCCLFALSTIGAWAQPEPPKGQPRFDPAKFQQMVEESLTKAAELTADEAKAFFPLYTEMRKKQREMGRQIHDLKKNAPQGDCKACAETITKIKRLQVEMAELEESYYQRFLKTLPAAKVFKVMKAEDDFHRRMVQGQRQGKRPEGQPRGQR